MRFCGLFVLLLLGAGNAAAEVRAVDGDSLVAEGRRVRLLGIDAPEYATESILRALQAIAELPLAAADTESSPVTSKFALLAQAPRPNATAKAATTGNAFNICIVLKIYGCLHIRRASRKLRCTQTGVFTPALANRKKKPSTQHSPCGNYQ